MNPKPLEQLAVAPWVADCLNDRDTRCFYMHGGVGSGKTFGMALKHYHWITENLDSKMSWFVEPTYNLVTQAAIPIWQNLFNLLGYKEKKQYMFINSKPQALHIYHQYGRHTVHFQSADRPQYMVAATIGGLTIDEAGEISEDVNVRASQRLRDKKVNYLLKQIGGAPQGINWFADFADFEGYDAEKKEKSYRISTYQNAHNLAPGFIEEQWKLYGHNKAKIRSWLFGYFANFFEGQACPEYNPERDRHEETAQPSIPISFTWDFNVQPLAWIALQKQWVDFGPLSGRHCHYTVGESSGNSSLIMEGVAEFAVQFPVKIFRNTRIFVTGDCSGHQRSTRRAGSAYDDIEQYLRDAGYKNISVIAPKSNPPVEVRVEMTNKAFSYGVCKVHNEHVNVNKSLINTQWDEDKRKLKKHSKDTITHWFDGLGYYLFEEIKTAELGKQKRPTVLI